MCLQNHDQIGNRAMGERLTMLADPDKLRAATALLLLSPFIPMLFMGEENGATSPFLFFTSHNDELAGLIREGRRAEFKHFAAFHDPARRDAIPDPNSPCQIAAAPGPPHSSGRCWTSGATASCRASRVAGARVSKFLARVPCVRHGGSAMASGCS